MRPQRCVAPARKALASPAFAWESWLARRTGADERVLPRAQVAKTLAPQISQYAQVVLQTLAYAGTGDVLQVGRPRPLEASRP